MFQYLTLELNQASKHPLQALLPLPRPSLFRPRPPEGRGPRFLSVFWEPRQDWSSYGAFFVGRWRGELDGLELVVCRKVRYSRVARWD